MARNCVNILKESQPDLYDYLRQKSGVDFDFKTGKGRQEYIKAAQDLQNETLSNINNILADLKVEGYEKLTAQPSTPQAKEPSTKPSGAKEDVVKSAKRILGVDDNMGGRVQGIINKAKDFDEFEKMVNADPELVNHLNSKFPGLQDISKIGGLEGEKIGTERGTIGVNKQQLMSLLGATMYDKPLAQVAVKELLQNSFDAVKARQNLTENKETGNIEISINRDERTISIKDDGIGMTPDIVKNAFLSIGGTNKEGLSAGERSGGLGLAKVQFLMGSQSVKVVTVRDGIKTTIDATNVQLYNDDFDIKTEKTNEPNGSFVEVKIPKDYKTLDGATKDIHFPGRWRGWNEFDILQKPLIGDANITVNYTNDGETKTETVPIGKNISEEKLPPQFTKVKFDWGEADVYMSVGKTNDPNHQILSSGIYQFDYNIRDSEYKTIPYNIVVNIKPSVGSTSEQYPFNNQREGFKRTVENDIGALKAYLLSYARGESEKEAVDVFSDIKPLPKVDPSKILTPAEREKLYADVEKTIEENKQRRVSKGEQSVEEAAKNIYINKKGEVRNQVDDTLLATNEKEFEKSFKAQREIEDVAPVNTEFFNPQFPQYHNNTNVDYIKTEGAVEFITDFGNTVLQLVRFAGDNLGYEYSKLKTGAEQKFFAGVSIDKTYGGVHIRKIINAIFVNPLAFDPQNLEEAVGVSLHITLHEINHTTASGEGANFTTDLAKLYGKIYASGKYGLFEGLFRSVYKKHFDTFQNLKNEYDKSTTKNLSRSFEGDSVKEPDKGNVPSDAANVPTGQSAEGGRQGDRPDTPADRTGDVISSKLSEAGKVIKPDVRTKLKELWDAARQKVPEQKTKPSGIEGETKTETAPAKKIRVTADQLKSLQPRQQKDFLSRMRALADKIEKDGITPDWAKADLPEGTKLQGFGGKSLDKAVAQAIRLVADALEKGKQFGEAIEAGFTHLKSYYTKNTKSFDEKKVREDFTNSMNDLFSQMKPEKPRIKVMVPTIPGKEYEKKIQNNATDPIDSFTVIYGSDKIIQDVLATHEKRDASYTANPTDYERNQMALKSMNYEMDRIVGNVLSQNSIQDSVDYFVSKLENKDLPLWVRNILSVSLQRNLRGRPDILNNIRTELDVSQATESSLSLLSRQDWLAERGLSTQQEDEIIGAVEGDEEIVSNKEKVKEAFESNEIDEKTEQEVAGRTAEDIKADMDALKKGKPQKKKSSKNSYDKDVYLAKAAMAENRILMSEKGQTKKNIVDKIKAIIAKC